jgi:KipI family sensor histidine kinase inhibitor
VTGRVAARPRIRLVGDSALLIEFAAVIDVAVNARAIAVANAMRGLNVTGVRDVVSTYRSVAVYFNPLTTDLPALTESAARIVDVRADLSEGRLVTIPVAYGGDHGPDLEAVAKWASLSQADVIERHAAATYRVFMLGFLPGFAYMGSVDPRIAAPRRETPRLQVPAGSVGIAGHQTAIYPRVSPGGWQLIGHTNIPVFNAGGTPAAIFAPGDRVRFVRDDSGGAAPSSGVDLMSPRADDSRQSSQVEHTGVTVVTPGLLTTVQDRGRWGYQSSGVSVSGAMDIVSHRLANVLVGNDDGAATLEATVMGPELRFEEPTSVSVTGADLGATVDGSPLAPGRMTAVKRGSSLRFGARRSGARAYVGVAGGIAVDPVLGSRSTHALTGLGGFGGRPLKGGDRIPIGRVLRGGAGGRPVPNVSRSAMPAVQGGASVRVLPGPQADFFDVRAFEMLHSTRFIVSPQSNRMGYRLTGAALPQLRNDLISDATFTGAIQVPASGEPILLMADRQTVGGYPQIAIVIAADLPLAGQLAPGDWVEFVTCTRAEAIDALAEQERRLAFDA